MAVDTRPRYYVRHYDEWKSPWDGAPAASEIRDAWYARFTSAALPRVRRAGTKYWTTRSTREVRLYAEQVCAVWNAEHETFIRS